LEPSTGFSLAALDAPATAASKPWKKAARLMMKKAEKTWCLKVSIWLMMMVING